MKWGRTSRHRRLVSRDAERQPRYGQLGNLSVGDANFALLRVAANQEVISATSAQKLRRFFRDEKGRPYQGGDAEIQSRSWFFTA